MVKHLPAMQETWVRSLGQEDPLEKEMATHSSVLAGRIPGKGEPGGLPSMGSHRVGHDWSDLTCMYALEKEVSTHSSILAWRIPGTEEPGGLPSMGSHRVRHDWATFTLPFPSPENLPDSGIEPGSPALQADSLLTELLQKPYLQCNKVMLIWTKNYSKNILLFRIRLGNKIHYRDSQ